MQLKRKSAHHIRITQDLWYHCEECDFKTSQTGNLKTHVRSVHEGLVFGCDQCDHKAKSNSKLGHHKQITHD